MNLIISGMALSNQWWPSLSHFEESLPQKRKSAPALVEQAGEVIYQAILGARPQPGLNLAIIIAPDQVELGQYLPLINRIYQNIEIKAPRSASLFDTIEQAQLLIQEDSDQQVLICELSLYGSAAILLSSPENKGQALVSLRSSAIPDQNPSLADYVLIDDPTNYDQQQTIDLLQSIFQHRSSSYPVSLGCKVVDSRSSEMIALIQSILTIRNQILPACNSNLEPILKDLNGSPFILNKEFRPWLSRGPGFKRSTLLIYRRQKGIQVDYLHLEEINQPRDEISVRQVTGSDPLLFPISGDDQEEILDKLTSLDNQLTGPDSITKISQDAYAKYANKKGKYTLAVLAGDRDQLIKELSHAKPGVNKSFQTGEDWTSPNGSYFTSKPLQSGKIAYVYPGAFNSYPGMAKELFFSFPGLQDTAGYIIPNISHSLAEEYVYLRSSRSDPEDSDDQILADFYQHPNQLIESGISLSVLHTMILDKVFNLRPDTALGYSLGEISMLWANNIWQNAQIRSESWKESTLFTEDLVGEMKAVRNYWSEHDLPEDFWRSYILKTDPALAKAACEQEPLAFLSIDNSPNEVVIVGEGEACQRVIDGIQCRALPMPFNAVIHNPAMQSCLPAFVDLYSNHVNPRKDISFFTAAGYRKIDLENENLAQTMAEMTCNSFDFPRLVNQVYDDGTRIFIEVGPQKTCSRWIEKILKDKPHAVIPVNKKYQQDFHGILKVLAMLLSHQVEFDLSKLYPQPSDRYEAESQVANQLPNAEKSVESDSSASSYEIPEGIPANLAESYLINLDQVSADLARSHQDYLKLQQVMTRNLAKIMALQADHSPAVQKLDDKKTVLYTREQIQSFTEGDHRLCFGDTFSGFGERRIPRLPNGDLQFIDRVIQINGESEKIQEGSTLTSEFDLPDQTWYLNGNPDALPYVALMEMALQPCGFLSAYMGSIKGREDQDLYFRNLDGEGKLISWPSTPERTITNQVKLLSSSSLEDVIIQQYSFDLSWGGVPFYQGTSSFGYFPLNMLVNQAGLDSGKNSEVWKHKYPEAGKWKEIRPASGNGISLLRTSLPVIDRVWISTRGGEFSAGYLYYQQDLQDSAWFYKAHFFEDPVMPGSLGVETMAQAITASLSAWDLPQNLSWNIDSGVKTNWKYRGQITPEIKAFEIEIHIKNISQTPSGWEIRADGMLWKDSKPIYKVEDLSLAAVDQ